MPAALVTLNTLERTVLLGVIVLDTISAAAAAAAAKSLQSCPTMCDPIDDSPPGSPVPGILQARALDWVAISFSRNIYITICKMSMIFMYDS